MRKERIIATIVIPVLTLFVAFLTFLFGQGILRNHEKDTQSNNQANITASEPDSDDSTTDFPAKPSETDSASGSTTQSGDNPQKPQEGVSQNQSVIVPNLLNMEQMEATDLLTSLGLEFQVWWTEENNGGSDISYIIDQSIPGGSTVPAGSLIRLEISAEKP